jgi:hypothetical protein
VLQRSAFCICQAIINLSLDHAISLVDLHLLLLQLLPGKTLMC